MVKPLMSHGTILTMSSLPFWALNVAVALLSMEGQKALGFHQKYLNLCSEVVIPLTMFFFLVKAQLFIY